MSESSPKICRRFLRISLRGLLLLILVIGVTLAWTMHEARRQAVAVAALEKIGCRIDYSASSSLTFLEWLRRLLDRNESKDVTEVDAKDSQVTDAGLVYLDRLTQPAWLRLERTPVSDAGMRRLQGLTQLETLNLRFTQVTDAGLVHLKGLTRLRSLQLDGTQVTDAGARNLKTALPGLHTFSWGASGGQR